MSNTSTWKPLEFHEIEKLLPFGSSWLFIDRVRYFDSSSEIICEKAVSASDPLIFSHFRSGPRIVPGVLMVEMVSQAAYLFERLDSGKPHHLEAGIDDLNKISLMGRCSATFHFPVYTGTLLDIHVSRQDIVNNTAFYRGEIFSNSKRMCTVQIFGVPFIGETDVNTPS